jgi:hypothetical protein
MMLHPEDVRYWAGWIVLGTIGFTVLYFVIRAAVIAAILSTSKGG